MYVARSAGAWVLAIGAARYAFLAAGWLLPWMREPLPPRYWRKVVAATQGIVLTIAAADVLPPAVTQAALVVALALLAESFGRDVWWLWRHRHASHAAASARSGRGRVRRTVVSRRVLTLLALLLVWVALVAPDQPSRLTLGAFVRVPLEGVVLVALALVLPGTARRLLAWVVGPVLGLLVIVKVLDIGFFTAFDRPFDPVDDWSYAGIGIETLRDSIGRTDANLAVAGAALLGVAVLVLTTLAVLRLTRVAAGHRRWSLRPSRRSAPSGCSAGCSARSSSPGRRSPPRAPPAWRSTRCVRCGPASRTTRSSPREIRRDRFRHTPADQLLTGLRGKDVLARVRRELRKGRGPGLLVLAAGRCRARQRGRSSCGPPASRPAAAGSPRRRSAASAGWRTPRCSRGSGSTAQRRYDQLVKSDRLTLSQAFKRAGWRTVDDVPSNNRAWPEGSSFYHYDKVYDRLNVGYRGPTFAYASMPDQYVLAALQRLELAKTDRRPLFAEVDLVSSHEPWTQVPPLIGWSGVGDGSVFNRLPVDMSRLCSDRHVRGVRPVDRVHAEHAVLVRASTTAQQSRARRAGRPSAGDDRHRTGRRATTCRSRSSPTTRRCCAGSPGGAGWTACGPARRRRSGR